MTVGQKPRATSAVAPAAELSSGDTAAWKILVVSVALGTLLRTLDVLKSGMWRDETIGLAVARLPALADILTFLRLHECHPPLFYCLIRIWDWTFGTSDAATMLLPLLPGILLIPLAYAIARQLFSPIAGGLAAFAVAISPDLAATSATVRPYSLLG